MKQPLFYYRKMDEDGRVAIPQDVQSLLGMQADRWMILYVEGDRLVVQCADEYEDKRKAFLL